MATCVTPVTDTAPRGQASAPDPRHAIMIMVGLDGKVSASLLALTDREMEAAQRIHDRIAPVLRKLQVAARAR
jgi:hypothetical protein